MITRSNRKVVALFESYGYSVKWEKPEQDMTRFQHEAFKVFVDFWDGRKGWTMGIYEPSMGYMRYIKPRSPNQIEEEITKIADNYN